MNNKFLLGIIPLYFGISCTYPVMAIGNSINLKTEQKILEENQIILAGSKEKYRIRARQKEDESRQKERHKLHEKIDRQIKQEMDKPHNRGLPKAEKERIIQEAHDALDRRLDRQWNTLDEYRERKKREEYQHNYYEQKRYNNNGFDPGNCRYYGNCNSWENQPHKIQSQPLNTKKKGLTKSELLANGMSFYHEKDFPKAEKIFRKLINRYPKEAKYHYYLGESLYFQGKLDQAIKEYKKAISIESDYTLAYNALGVLFSSKQDWEAAITQYKKALSINPNYADAMKNLGQALWEKGSSTDAIAAWKKSLDILVKQKRYTEAKEVVKLLQSNTNEFIPSY